LKLLSCDFTTAELLVAGVLELFVEVAAGENEVGGEEWQGGR